MASKGSKRSYLQATQYGTSKIDQSSSQKQNQSIDQRNDDDSKNEPPNWNQVFEKPVYTERKKRRPISFAEAAQVRVIPASSKAKLDAPNEPSPPYYNHPPSAPKKSSAQLKPVIFNPATGTAIEKKGKLKQPKPTKPSKLKLAVMQGRNDEIGYKETKSEPSTEQENSESSSRKLLPARHAKQHTNHYHPWIKQLITVELEHRVTCILKKLTTFHTRAKNKANLAKSLRGKRLCIGIRSSVRSVQLKKAKFLVISPCVEAGDIEGGIEDTIKALVELAMQQNIPVVFALTRKKLAQALGKNVRTSIVAIISVEGCHSEYQDLMQLHEQTRVLAALLHQRRVLDFRSHPDSQIPFIESIALVESMNHSSIVSYLFRKKSQSDFDQEISTNRLNLKIDLDQIKSKVRLRAFAHPPHVGSITWDLHDQGSLHSNFYPYVTERKPKGEFMKILPQGGLLPECLLWPFVAGNYQLDVHIRSSYGDSSPILFTMKCQLLIAGVGQVDAETDDVMDVSVDDSSSVSDGELKEKSSSTDIIPIYDEENAVKSSRVVKPSIPPIEPPPQTHDFYFDSFEALDGNSSISDLKTQGQIFFVTSEATHLTRICTVAPGSYVKDLLKLAALMMQMNPAVTKTKLIHNGQVLDPNSSTDSLNNYTCLEISK